MSEPIHLTPNNKRFHFKPISLKAFDTKENLSSAIQQVSFENNNLQSSDTMKISAMPATLKPSKPSREQCSLQRSSSRPTDEDQDEDEEEEEEEEEENRGPMTRAAACDWQEESKVPLSSGIKRRTDEDQEDDDEAPDLEARITRGVKRLSCQEAIIESEDFNMEKIGR